MSMRRKAFTLVEMLAAVGLLALVAGAGYAVFGASVRVSTKARRVGEMVSRARSALTLLADDLRRAVPHEELGLMSLDVEYGGEAADTIDFVVPADPETRAGDPESTGLVEVGYYIDTDPDTEATGLMRREDRTLDDDPLGGGTLTCIAPGVTRMELAFYDGFLWESGWSDEGELPEAVRIRIVVTDEDEQELPKIFGTTVRLMAR